MLVRANRQGDRLREQYSGLLEQQRQLAREQINASIELQGTQLGLLEKAFAQLRATNAWEYQSIMAMNASGYDETTYDPSPEAEALRIAERQNKKDELDEALTAEEESALDDIFPGFVG